MKRRDPICAGLLAGLLLIGAGAIAQDARQLDLSLEGDLDGERQNGLQLRQIQPLDWLYEVDVPVAGRSAQARDQAAADALLVLLSRLSGLADVPQNRAVENALKSPARFYSQFDYRSEQSRGQRQLLLHVMFDAAPVNELMQRAELPLWGSRRRSVVAWLALDDGSLSLINAQEPTFGEVLQQRARERGVPLKLPSMADLRSGVISAQEIWRESDFTLRQAELLYEADVLATGRLRERSDGLTGLVTLKLDGQERRVRVSGIDRESAARRLVDQLVALLAEQQVVQSRAPTGVEFGVVGIDDVAQYAALLRYLQSLEYLRRVDLLSATQERFNFRVETAASPRQLQNLLTGDGYLSRGQDGLNNWLVWTAAPAQ